MHTTTRRPPPVTEAPAHRSRADEVYAQLKRDVAEFNLVPGDRFTENELSERLGVSRTPVRQALFRLQQEGYVEVLFRSGWRVLPFDFEQFEQLYDLRMVLETTAAAIRFRVDQARQALNECFSTRCTLINKAGSCAQCAGFHTWLYGDHRETQKALFGIELQQVATPEERAATLDQRLQIVRAADPVLGEGAKFHEALMTFLREVSHY